MNSELLKRLSKEKPKNKADEVTEALKRGYSMEQILKALQSGQTEVRQGILKYSRKTYYFEVPYTYETFMMLCKVLSV